VVGKEAARQSCRSMERFFSCKFSEHVGIVYTQAKGKRLGRPKKSFDAALVASPLRRHGIGFRWNTGNGSPNQRNRCCVDA
jgi:hypothetical protein